MDPNLNPIHRLYPDPPDGPATRAEDGLSPEAAAEVAALQPVRDALDALPRQRPAASVVEVVVAAAVAAHAEADLGAVRALYGEELADASSGAPAAELAAFRPLRDALEALPRQRPYPSVVDAVVASAATAHAEVTLRSVRVLYGEELAEADLGAQAAEVAALRPVRDALGALPPQRPDASVVDAVVAAAARPAAGRAPARAHRPPARADRPADRRTRRLAGVFGSLVALVLAASIVLFAVRSDEPASIAEAGRTGTVAPDAAGSEVAGPDAIAQALEPDQPEADAEIPAADGPSAGGALAGRVTASPAASLPSVPPPSALPPSAGSDALAAGVRPAAGRAAAPPAARPDPTPDLARRATAAVVPEADVSLAVADPDEAFRLLYLRLEALQEAGLGWDEPPAVLGAEPATSLTAPARGWVQVRVER